MLGGLDQISVAALARMRDKPAKDVGVVTAVVGHFGYRAGSVVEVARETSGTGLVLGAIPGGVIFLRERVCVCEPCVGLDAWDHYDYSGDQLYLRERAYPLMRNAAEFILNNLFDDGKGHLVSGPSLSPENRYFTPDHQKASLDLSPTMDVEITTALFKRVIDAANKQKVDAPLVSELERRH